MSTSNLKQIINTPSTFCSIRWVGYAFIAHRYIIICLRFGQFWQGSKKALLVSLKKRRYQQHAKPAFPWGTYAKHVTALENEEMVTVSVTTPCDNKWAALMKPNQTGL